ncbi:hypothetical protein [Fictibacillus enclensis]|uniref:hypothetical protein n=1 Tax=Fictibacillus enclensis TaxID=1017270 RepID=UPI0024BFAEAF|nr:hypothetical protein [Fictibacillus enclensis]WHY72633.1 hypothetical protein QNH15_01450 [Fictibacillus enclensis]
MRFRLLAFRGRALSLTGVNAYFTGVNAYFLVASSCGNGASASLVSSVPLFPLDKERLGSDPSHEENVMFIFEESRTLHFNQPHGGILPTQNSSL